MTGKSKLATRFTCCLMLAAALPACRDKDTQNTPHTAPPVALETRTSAEHGSESPLLVLKEGDFWRYAILLELYSRNLIGLETPPPPEVSNHEMIRTYAGKMQPFPDKPELRADAFKLEIPGEESEYELMDVHEKQIDLRGSIPFKNGQPSAPIWLDTPIPFVASGIRVGSPLPALSLRHGEGGSRQIQVVGREDVTVPAGTFRAIKLLMSGMDDTSEGLEIRRATWFAPGVGVVKDVTNRYSTDAKLSTRILELVETSVSKP